MSAGLPLLVLSVLSLVVLFTWAVHGPGSRTVRITISAAFAMCLLLCWVVLLLVGVFQDAGLYAMGAAFILSLSALFVPVAWRRLMSRSVRE